MRNLCIRLLAKLKGQRLVYLRDLDGGITLAREIINPWGEKTVIKQTDTLLLMEDGSVSRYRNRISYVKDWRYVDENTR